MEEMALPDQNKESSQEQPVTTIQKSEVPDQVRSGEQMTAGPSPKPPEQSVFKNPWFWALVVLGLTFVVGVLIWYFFFTPKVNREVANVSTPAGVDTSSGGSARQTPQDNFVVVGDQVVSGVDTLFVDRVEVVEPGFLALALASPAQQDTLDVLVGITSILTPGVYTDFEVNIFDEASLDQLQRSRVYSNTHAFAVLYKDVDADSIFNADIDSEFLKNSQGQDVVVGFNLRSP